MGLTDSILILATTFSSDKDLWKATDLLSEGATDLVWSSNPFVSCTVRKALKMIPQNKQHNSASRLGETSVLSQTKSLEKRDCA